MTANPISAAVMPAPGRTMESVAAFAREVPGNKNLRLPSRLALRRFVECQVVPATTPDKSAPDSCRIFVAAWPGMTAETQTPGCAHASPGRPWPDRR